MIIHYYEFKVDYSIKSEELSEDMRILLGKEDETIEANMYIDLYSVIAFNKSTEVNKTTLRMRDNGLVVINMKLSKFVKLLQTLPNVKVYESN